MTATKKKLKVSGKMEGSPLKKKWGEKTIDAGGGETEAMNPWT